MSDIRNVTLEILRHGPPHNQLLSPLTRYLALCGDHPSAAVEVPYEHREFLARHDALTYKHELQSGLSPAQKQSACRDRELQLQITAQEMSGMLAKVPGLISELKNSGDEDGFTHFELVISAAELALLPFELATSPNGFPGAGQPLTLQSESPLSMTRRVRRVRSGRFQWPNRPRILFAVNLPPADENQLLPAHLLALRRAIEPWVGRDMQDDPHGTKPPRWVAEYLTVLRNASVNRIFDELGRHDYTHLHVLAHGVQYAEGVDTRFALSLSDPIVSSKPDLVSAARLAALVRRFRSDRSHQLTLPAVITLAACNGADGGSVVGAGSSIAHALHEAGIPLVVASQFPFSFAGSIIMADVLYPKLLWGDDPRAALSDLRRQLKLRLPSTHDWASLVAYASLPADIDQQLEQVRFHQALRSIEAAFSYSDAKAAREDAGGGHGKVRDDEAGDKLGKVLLDRLAEAKTKLHRLQREMEARGSAVPPEQMAHVYGRLASTEKRLSEIEYVDSRRQSSQPPTPPLDPESPTETKAKWKSTLAASRALYKQAFDADRSQTWALVQAVALSIIVDDKPDRVRDDWSLAELLSKIDVRHDERAVRAWAISSLIELELVSLWFRVGRRAPSRDDMTSRYQQAFEKFQDLTEQLKANVREQDWELVSLRRQLGRYLNWFYADYATASGNLSAYQKFPNDVPCLIKGLCAQLLTLLDEA